VKSAGEQPIPSRGKLFFYLPVPRELRQRLSVLVDGVPEVEEPDHVTVVHVPGEAARPDVHVVNAVRDAVREVLGNFAPLTAKVTGLAFFDEARRDGGPQTAVVALVTAVGLDRVRDAVMGCLRDRGIHVSDDWSFTPHVTLGWLPRGDRTHLGTAEGIGWDVTDVAMDAPDGPSLIPLNGSVATEAVREAGHVEDRARARLQLSPADLARARRYLASKPLPPVDLYIPADHGYLVASPTPKGHVLTTALGPGMAPRGVPASDLLGPPPQFRLAPAPRRPAPRAHRDKQAGSDDAEDAPGIPSRATSHELPTITSPTRWELAVQHHDAEVRGPHLDLRLGDPSTGQAHSWAMPPRWPAPGERSWAIQQPTHTVKYMDFTGRIPEGYGKGSVALRDRTQTEVISARPGHVNFNVYRGSGPEEYTLHRVDGRKWLLYNRTPTRDTLGELPPARPAYRDTTPAAVDVNRDDEVMSAKIDDAHNLFVFPRRGQIRVLSHRASGRAAGVIEHTHKVPGVFGVSTPEGLGDTVIRGGLYAVEPRTGRAVASPVLAGLLNSNVWRSRSAQENAGELRPVIYDVVRYRGEPFADKPYDDKLRVLREVTSKVPSMTLPPMAETASAKRKLLEQIRSGELGDTREGVVMWNRVSAAPPTKAKFRETHDVYVRGFFPGSGKYAGRAVGGFTYSHTPDGPVVGRCGTGLSDAQRIDMHDKPDAYLGLVATVQAHEKFPSEALRVPAFDGWHLDKNPQPRLDAVIH
jgi:2'-5' RNA ligase